MTQYSNWLSGLEQLGIRDDLPAMVFDGGYSVVWQLASHEVFGDFTSGAFEMEIKTAPLSTGTVAATGTVASGAVSGGVNPVTIDVPLSARGGLTEPTGDGATDIYFVIYFTPTGGEKTAVRGGVLPLLAGV